MCKGWWPFHCWHWIGIKKSKMFTRRRWVCKQGDKTWWVSYYDTVCCRCGKTGIYLSK